MGQQVRTLCEDIIANDEEESATFDEFLKVVFTLRSTRPNDLIVDLRQYVRQRFDTVMERIDMVTGEASTQLRDSRLPSKSDLTQSSEKANAINQTPRHEVPLYVR